MLLRGTVVPEFHCPGPSGRHFRDTYRSRRLPAAGHPLRTGNGGGRGPGGRFPGYFSASQGEDTVARMTDPGWVFLMVSAAGLIVERGSLLSHTAIIGRELAFRRLLA